MMAEFATLWSFPAATIERFGWVLVHSLWQFSLVAALAGAAAGAMRRSSAAARYGMLVVAMTALVAAPVVTWSLQVPALAGGEHVEFAPADPPADVTGFSASLRAARTRNAAANGVDPAATRVAAEPLAAPAWRPHTGVPLAAAWLNGARSVLRPWLAWIVAGWSLGVVACSFRPLLGGYALWRLRRCGVSPARDEVLDASRRVSMRLGLRRAVRVLQSTVAPMPIALGWLRPVILLPVALVTSMPAAQLEAILAHELAHVRRHDFLVNLLQTLVETVFFYHPAVWWLSRRIRVEREHCCDDLVVQVLGDRVEYGRALVAVEESRGPSPLLAVGVTDGSLLARVRRIAAAGPDRAALNWGDRWPLLSLGMTCTLLAATALWVGVGSASDQPSERDAATHAAEPGGAVNEPAAVAVEQPSRSDAGGQQGSTEPSPAARPAEAWSVAGRVVDEAGRPLAGVVVSAHTGMGTAFRTGKAETGADGEYRFNFGPGLRFTDGIELQGATISARKPGYFERNLSRQGDLLMARRLPEGEIGWGKKTKDDVILPGQTRRLDFVMLPAARLAGTLIDQDNRPLAGYGVSLTGEELPPSSSVIASVKTDDKGRFSISEIPTMFAFQILVEPAKREPPWNAWASGPFHFAAGEADLSVRQGDTEIVAERFELQVLGAGVNWKQALRLGASQQKLNAATGTRVGVTSLRTASGTRLQATSLRLRLDPGEAPEGGSAKPADEPAGQPNREQVGEVLGRPVYRDEVDGDKLGKLLASVIEQYAAAHRAEITPTEEEIRYATEFFDRQHRERLAAEGRDVELREQLKSLDARIAQADLSADERRQLEGKRNGLQLQLDPPGRMFATFMLNGWKLQKHLYDHFGGGRILWQQGGVEAFDAMRTFLETQEQQGRFKITDPQSRAKVYEYWNRDHGAFLTADQERIRSEFLEPAWIRPASSRDAGSAVPSEGPPTANLPHLQDPLPAALARAAAFIESQRASDGGWRSGPTAGAYRDGMTALCALALLRAGRTRDDAAVKESLDRLQQVRPEFTYSVALHTVALCAADPTKHREVIRKNVAWLAETQTAEGEASGGWSYGPQRSLRSDGSNTRFAVWALDEAARAGVPAPEATWQAAAGYWLRSQQENGSWGYMPQVGAGTVTMTLAGIASLAAARRAAADEAAQHAIDAAIQRAWRWHDERFSVEQLGRGSPWQFYSLQALGLAASLTDHRRIGDLAWREQALPLLLRLQDVDAGSWQGQAAEPPLVATSLAILSLTSVP